MVMLMLRNCRVTPAPVDQGPEWACDLVWSSPHFGEAGQSMRWTRIRQLPYFSTISTNRGGDWRGLRKGRELDTNDCKHRNKLGTSMPGNTHTRECLCERA